jgi:N-acetylglutamate synthase-like GNAT family acetyltransferase
LLQFEPYSDKLKSAFYELNIVWLKEMSLLEPYDEYVLKNPVEAIVEKGGEIFFGILKGEVVATVALMPTAYGALELNKMAVKKECQGRGMGHEIMQFVLDQCRSNGVKEVELYSNLRLKNAIHLYHKFGFVEIPLTKDSPYDRADIRMKIHL